MAPAYGSGAYGAGPYSGTTYENELRAFNSFPLILVEIQFPSGTQYFSGAQLQFDERPYEGRVASISQFRRAIQQNLGIFEVSSIDVQFADTDQALINLASTTRIKGQIVTFKLGTADLPLADYTTFHEGKIDDFGGANFSFRILVRDRLWTMPINPQTGVVTLDDFPNALPRDVGKPIPVCYGTHSDTGTDDARNRGAWPCLFVDVTSTERTFLVAGHAVSAISQVYAYKPSAGSQLLTLTTDYVPYTNGTLNGQTMAYIKLTTTGFNKLADSTDLGILTCNVIGKTNAPDGTGDVYTDPIDVLSDFLTNYCGNPTKNTDRFAEARLVSIGRTYTVRGGYTQEKRTDEVLSELCNSFNIRIFPDLNGNVAVDIFEPAGPTDVVQDIREMWEVIKGSFSIDFVSGIQGAEDAQVVNYIDYQFGYHHAKEFYASSYTVEDNTSQSLYGEKKLSIQLPWVANQATGSDVANRILTLYRNPVDHVICKVPLMGMLVDLADQVSVTHPMGVESGGYDAVQFEVLEHTFNPQDWSVDLRMRNVSTISQRGYFLDDEDARVRVSDGTIAVINGNAAIEFTGATSLITAGVQVGDIIRIKSCTNEANRLSLKITSITDLNTLETAQTVWTTESGMTYEIVPSWLTASNEQALYGHLADSTTGTFSDAAEGFVFI